MIKLGTYNYWHYLDKYNTVYHNIYIEFWICFRETLERQIYLEVEKYDVLVWFICNSRWICYICKFNRISESFEHFSCCILYFSLFILSLLYSNVVYLGNVNLSGSKTIAMLFYGDCKFVKYCKFNKISQSYGYLC